MAAKHWKDRQKPTIEHIVTLFDQTELGAYVAGHLLIESVLVQLIELVMTGEDKFNPFDMSWPNKVALMRGRHLIGEKWPPFLLELNRARNHVAHHLGERVTFDTMFALAQLAAAAGVEFSDDSVHADRAVSLTHYGIEGLIQEVFQNTAQDLSLLMEKHGGTFCFSQNHFRART